MPDFLIFCMATVGLTAILVDGKIFLPFRERLENRVREQEERQQTKGGKMRRTWSGFLLGIITCYQCCGFWSGLFCGLYFTVSHFVVFFSAKNPFVIFSPFFLLLCGFAGSFLATVYLMFAELIFAKTMLYRRTNPDPLPDDIPDDEMMTDYCAGNKI